ncbi:MAG: DUF1439 domain-containing protein [Aquabacterium sp.]|uniref:DUF1439 domain-containing protein n=1 Tax=Aquabacterium sp. TaxID=1872578 RepID=UPI0025BE634F|nr:DUF1439 domain-containing protein [Aquabacterium sp.]MBI5926751.1 DUF1439 domain-containing protein [Aquabacterium sp.]
MLEPHAPRHLTSRATLRRRTMLLAPLAIAGLLAACATLLGPRTIEISRDELLTKLGKQFPTTKRVMKLLDVTASLPSLDLQEEKNRVTASVDLAARELLMGQEYKGKVALSFGLRFEPKDLTLRLTEPKVEQVAVEGLPAIYQRALTNLGAKLVEETLNDYPVHQLKPEDLRTADRLGYQVKDIAVTRTGLAVHLVPRP